MKNHILPCLPFLTRVALVGAFLVLGSLAPARADVIYSNFGPSNGIDTSVGGAVFQNPGGGRQDLAVQFTVGAGSYRFISAELALGYFSGTNLVDVVLFSDTGANAPGTAVQTITLTGIPSGYSVVAANTVAPLTLNANTSYWLGAIAHDGANDAWARTSALGDFGFAAVRDASLVWQSQFASRREAFRINGTPLAAPEASSLLLLLTGLTTLAFSRRTFSRKAS